jgi:DNA polymerase-3 subunit beta
MPTTYTPIVTMQLTTQPGALSTALGAALRIIPPRAVSAALNNVLLEATEDGLYVRATNLETGLRKLVEAVVSTEGSVCVLAKPLADFVSNLPNSELLELTLEQDPDNDKMLTLVLSCGDYETRMIGTIASEFPPGQEIVPRDQVTVPLVDLLYGISQIDEAIPEKENTPSRAGALFVLQGGTLTLAAVDNHRLAERQFHVNADGVDCRIIVPLRAIRELPRTFKGESGDVEILVAGAGNLVAFRTPTTEMNSRLLDGTFPNYAKAFPQVPHPTDPWLKVTVSADELKQALKVVLPTSEDAHVVRVAIEQDSMRLTCQRQGLGESKAKVAIKTDGAAFPMQISFNALYLLDALGSMDTANVELHLLSPTAPGMLVPESQPIVYRHTIMPMTAPGAGGSR